MPDAAVRTEPPASRWSDFVYLLLVYLVWGSTYLAIRIAVALGWLVLGESITLWTVSGMALVLLGVAGVFRDRYQQARG